MFGAALFRADVVSPRTFDDTLSYAWEYRQPLIASPRGTGKAKKENVD